MDEPCSALGPIAAKVEDLIDRGPEAGRFYTASSQRSQGT
jgi:ABC-type phosphate transport system ATPase subunit